MGYFDSALIDRRTGRDGTMPNELISYSEFAPLRLAKFLEAHPSLLKRIAEMEGGWEFMGGLWLGEGLVFTDFLRLESLPDELGCVSLDLSSLPEKVSLEILDKLGLPIRPGMNRDEIEACLGKPERTLVFVKDRKRCDFTVGRVWPYHVSCTILNRGGLIFLVVARKDVLARCEAD